MALLIALSVFAVLLAGITYYGYRVYFKPGLVMEQLREPDDAGLLHIDPSEIKEQRGLAVRFIELIGEKVPISPADAGTTRRYLIAAGYRSDRALKVYYGLKVLLCGVMLILGLMFRDYITMVPLLRTVIVVGAALFGWYFPTLVLDHLVAKRQEAIRLSLPDALDLLVVCVEAGLGLDQALLNVSRELRMTHKEICEELGLVTFEMRAGKRRAEALHNLAERTGETELQNLVAIMIQSDRFGTSVADSLRTHAEFMRIRRRQEAEERAGKVGVKLVFPIFFFILPAIMIVTAGPGIIQVVTYLIPTMKNL